MEKAIDVVREKIVLVENALLPITILEQWEEDGPQEDRHSGFLTSANHAMFVDQPYGHLMLVKVEPTNDPSVYLTIPGYVKLGHVGDADKHAETVEAAAKMLNNMTAYEFVVKVILNLEVEVNFTDKIIPIPVSSLQEEDNLEIETESTNVPIQLTDIVIELLHVTKKDEATKLLLGLIADIVSDEDGKDSKIEIMDVFAELAQKAISEKVRQEILHFMDTFDNGAV